MAALLRGVHLDPRADLPELDAMLERASGAPEDDEEMPQEAFAAVARAAFEGIRESLRGPKKAPGKGPKRRR